MRADCASGTGRGYFLPEHALRSAICIGRGGGVHITGDGPQIASDMSPIHRLLASLAAHAALSNRLL